MSQIEALVESRGAHYNVFKNRPGMLSLFDACKKLQEDTAVSLAAARDSDSSDEFADE